MIPKIIHYCWFGQKPYPRLVKQCMQSWEKYCLDYKVFRWDESNAPVSDNKYVQQAYSAGKWAFVSDYVRLKVLDTYGGIYLDTDVELLRPFDTYLQEDAFLGFESAQKIATCVIGAVPQHPLIEGLLKEYSDRQFVQADGSFDETTNVIHMTKALTECGLILNGRMQKLDRISVYPMMYFSPKDLETGKINVTKETTAIHYFQASWMSLRQRFHTQVAQLLGPQKSRKMKQLLGRDYDC